MARSKRGPTSTRAGAALTAAGIPFELRSYDAGALDGDTTLGEAVAGALGIDPRSMFKTLIALVDDGPVCAIVPVCGTLSLKALAAAAGGKRATMADPRDAERWTGYVTGGISPIGQSKSLPTFLDASALEYDRVCVSAGQRGLQLELAPADLVRATSASSIPELSV